MRIVRFHYLLVMFLAALVLHIGNLPIYAHDTSNSSKGKLYLVNTGGGFSSFGLSLGISLSSQFGRSLVSIRYIYNTTFMSLSPREETVWDLGALYGLSSKTSSGFSSISGGVSIVGGNRYDIRDEWSTFLTVGIPIEGQMFWKPYPSLGIGIYGFANLNPEKSFVGALLCLQYRILR